jgi:hypothetical protein
MPLLQFLMGQGRSKVALMLPHQLDRLVHLLLL